MNRKIINLLKRINSAIVHIRGMSPPGDIPATLVSKYTMGGDIEVKKMYFNDVGLSFLPRINTQRKINSFFRKIENRKEDHYPGTDRWLYKSLEKYSIEGTSCVVMGSGSAFYETVCLYFGAKSVTTIEYNKIIFLHPQMRTMTPAEYDKHRVKFDVGMSISSFEHDGLGRYGDPLNPEADLEAMGKMKTIIKKDGMLFLAVPVGKDLLVWNANRIYGRIRLPLLLKGWEVLDTFGFVERRLDTGEGGSHQPIFVLKNT
jgi:hypothetical protein